MSATCVTAIVVGTGVSGLCAALALGRRGCKVIVLEKQSQFGGNGKWALTGINLYNTSAQESRNITDSAVLFKKDILCAGANHNNPALVDILVGGVKTASDLLRELDITVTDVVNSGGHSVCRTHKPPNWPTESTPMGQLLVGQLLAALEKMPNVEMLLGAEVVRLVMEDVTATRDSAVRGVIYRDTQTNAEIGMDAKAVTWPLMIYDYEQILATGGYIADMSGDSLLAEVCAHLCCMPTSCGPHANGSGMRMARAAGAELIGMKSVQIDPCGIINQADPTSMQKDLCPSLIRSAGALLINEQGQRICNELDLNHKMSAAIAKACSVHRSRLTSGREQHRAFMLINMEVLSHIEMDGASILQHQDAGQSFGSIRQFCITHGVPAETLQETFTHYASSAAAGRDEFGKSTFPVHRFSLDDPLWMVEVTPVLHHGNGGIRVNGSSEVMCTRQDGTTSILLGLYAAGECAGGVHGMERLSGNGLLDSIVFGTNSGRRAAESILLGDAAAACVTMPEWTRVTLRHRCRLEYLSIKGLSHLSREGINDIPTDLYEFCFELPASWSTLNIPAGAAVAVKAHVNGIDIIRHYTPISRPDTRGSVSLYLKALPDKGMMSRHLFFLRPGDQIQMMGPEKFPRVKYLANAAKPYPAKMVMLAGGSGAAPMIQLIDDVIQRGVNCQMLLLWGVESQRDLVFRTYLDHMQAEHPDKLKVVYCVSTIMMAIRAGHLHLGLIDSDLLRQELLPDFGPAEDLCVVICGPAKMSVAMMAALGHMGYHEDKVFSFNE